MCDYALEEVFAALILDTRYRLMALEGLFRGTIDGASVHRREIVRRALLDHIVIGDDMLSFAERELLQEVRLRAKPILPF